MSILRKLLTLIVALSGVLFVFMGLRWLVDPGGVAPDLGLTLESGVGLSSQVGDLAGFFLTLGLCILMALVTKHRTWYYPAIGLLSIAAAGRVVAWVAHDAALAANFIGLEVIVSLILFAASRILPETK